MLVLERKVGEEVIIALTDNSEIVVKVTMIKMGYAVKLGFTASPDIKINRKEVILPESYKDCT